MTTNQPSTQLPAEYRIEDGIQVIRMIGTDASIYVIPAGETTIVIGKEQYVTVVHGTIQRGKNMFTPRTRFLVPEGKLVLSCKEPAAFLLDGSTTP
ncbi:MAG: hypothetical protein HGA33_06020 [Candidatus Moranbacteria bacterium]|nr:hypothetical protein [Candidatus Moranbacteria bacterium]